MSRRSKITLPQHLRLTLNLRTGLYEGSENGVLYQLTFTQMNDLKIYCRVSHGSIVPTLETWYKDLTSYSRRAVKATGPQVESENGFYPDEEHCI